MNPTSIWNKKKCTHCLIKCDLSYSKTYFIVSVDLSKNIYLCYTACCIAYADSNCMRLSRGGREDLGYVRKYIKWMLVATAPINGDGQHSPHNRSGYMYIQCLFIHVRNKEGTDISIGIPHGAIWMFTTLFTSGCLL